MHKLQEESEGLAGVGHLVQVELLQVQLAGNFEKEGPEETGRLGYQRVGQGWVGETQEDLERGVEETVLVAGWVRESKVFS